MFSSFDSLPPGNTPSSIVPVSLQYRSSIAPASQGLAVGPGVLSSPEEQAWQV